MIPYGKQQLTAEDILAVTEVLQGTNLTQGPKIAEFEKALCDYTGARYCVATSNGTAALHIAVAALDLPPKSEGITTPITFMATSNSMLYCGVKPVFADICKTTYNLDISAVKRAQTSQTRLLMPVHYAGQPCKMQEIAAIAKESSLAVIEDAAHAIGSCYQDGSMVGNCRYSDMTTFSFHPVKNITCGEGGAVMTNNPALYKKLCQLRNHGITSDPADMTQCPRPHFHEMHTLGFNYRLTDIQAALGISQLKKLQQFKAARRRVVAIYNRDLAGIKNLTLPVELPEMDSCFHLYVIKLDFSAIGKSRAQVMTELMTKGIFTQVHYTPVPTQPYYQRLGYSMATCPDAAAFYEQCLSIPLYPSITDAEIKTVVKSIKEAIS